MRMPRIPYFDRPGGFVTLAALLCGLAARPGICGFGSTEVFLPAVGRAPGSNGAQIYTTVWATNLTGAPEAFTFHFLKQGQSNATASSPIARSQAGAALASTSFSDTLAPGETKVYENVVESKLGLSGVIGAARIVSSGEIFVSERIFNQSPGDDLGKTEGMFFTGVPKGFSISAGQSASVQAADQGGSENFRTNFVLVETGGGSPTVNVQVFDGGGTMLGQKAYPLLPYEQILPNIGDVVPGIATTNARITATVTAGTGSAILALAQIANESQDPSGAEMSFRDSLLGSGGGTAGVTSLNALTGALTLKAGNGISITPSGSAISIAFTGGGSSGLTSVTHDASLSGAGTGASPLAIATSGVGNSQLAAGAVTAPKIASGQVVTAINGLHDNLTLAAGSNVTITPNGSTLTVASSGGHLALPYSDGGDSSNPAFQIGNIEGPGVSGTSATSGVNAAPGVLGQGVDRGVIGSLFGGGSGYTPTVAFGVWGDATGSGVGVIGTSAGNDGVFGHSSSSNGVEGHVSNSSAGVAGVNQGSGPGIYGENQSGGYAGDFFGDVIVGGNITYSGSLTHSSDARFKENIAPLRQALDGILGLRAVTFDWRRDEFPRRNLPAGRSIGFVAQEVEAVYPEIVSTDRDGFKGVDYAALTPILVEAIKTQQQRIESLQRQLDELTRRIGSLEGTTR